MNKFLTTFNTEDEYQDFINSNECQYINVSHIIQTDKNKYYEELYSQQLLPFTIEVLEYHTDEPVSKFSFSNENWAPYEAKYQIYDHTTQTYSDWKPFLLDYNRYYTEPISLSVGDKIRIIGNRTDKNNFPSLGWTAFDTQYDTNYEDAYPDELKLKISGNMMSWYTEDYVYATPESELFNNSLIRVNGVTSNTNCLKDASDLFLPTRGLMPNIFRSMFERDNSLIAAPDILAKYIPDTGCYFMFYDCKNLEDMPIIAAETIEKYAFTDMFNNCTSLVNTTELHVKHIVASDSCNAFDRMFQSCYSLTAAPQWDADIDLVIPNKYYSGNPDYVTNGQGYNGIFYAMFSGCESLQTCNWHITFESAFDGSNDQKFERMFGSFYDENLSEQKICNALATIPTIEIKNNTNYERTLSVNHDIFYSGDGTKTQNLINSWTVLGIEGAIYVYDYNPPTGFDTSSGTFYLSSNSEYLPGGSLENDYPLNLYNWTKSVYVPSNP